ncbi:MAG: BrnT family toxin [Thiobacillus sp.]|nr:BrnT family toxin [Thiobacillus sp.]
MIKFEWDATKAEANARKHGVSFEEAQSVFYDEFAVQFFDEDHSGDEERFLLLGMSTGARLLLVCHCERKTGDTKQGTDHDYIRPACADFCACSQP